MQTVKSAATTWKTLMEMCSIILLYIGIVEMINV